MGKFLLLSLFVGLIALHSCYISSAADTTPPPVPSTSTETVVTKSDVTNSEVTNSEVTSSDATNSDVSSSDATSSDVTNSDVTNSDLTNPSATSSEATNADVINTDSPSVDDQNEPQEISKSNYPSPTTINMTQVDQFYNDARIEEPQVVDSWRRMGSKLKKSISSIIGQVTPYALNMSQEAKISSNCSGAMLKWVLSMNQLKSWALRMLDASGKPIAGLLEGSMTMFGNYRECLKIRAPDDDEIEFANGEFREFFRGKYCVIQAKPWLPEKDRFYNLNTKIKSLMEPEEDEDFPWWDKTVFNELSEWALAFNFVNIRFDICVPSLCSREDMQKAVSFLLKNIDLKARVLRCEMDSPDTPSSSLSFFPTMIESGSQDIAEALGGPGAVAMASMERADSQSKSSSSYFSSTYGQLGWILAPAFSILLVLLATALSMAIGGKQARSASSKISHTIRSLSLKRSVSSHLDIDYDQLADDKPLALYGLRFLLVLWIILVESAVNLKFEYLRELLMLKDLIFWWPMQFIINSTLQFDSIILLTAFTMAYKNCLNESVNNLKSITRFVLDKYIRLMPSIMVMVAFVILLPLCYRGPVWNDYVARQSAVCQSTGWVNSVFLQNYLPYGEICLPQTWLLCVEFQLIILMAPLVYYLNKSYLNNFEDKNDPKSYQRHGLSETVSTYSIKSRDACRPLYWLWTFPGTLLIGCIAIGLSSSFYNVFRNELPPSWFYTMADPDSKAIYFNQHMMRLWTHLAVFAMGILAGVECRRAARNLIHDHGSNGFGFMPLSRAAKHQSGLSTSSLPVIFESDNALSKSQNDVNNSSISINVCANMNRNSRMGVNSDRSDESIDRGTERSINGYGSNEHTSKIGRCRSICCMALKIICTLMAVAIMAAVIFSTHDWSLNDLPRPSVAGMFDAGSRFLWSMAMIWILYMVSVPNRKKEFSLFAKILGHPLMVFLGRLSFLIYIIHPFVHTAVLAIQEQPIYSSWLMLVHILIGNMTITVMLASLVSLFVEMPCRNLFRRCGTSLLLTQNIVSESSSSSNTAATSSTSARGAHLR